MPYEYLGQSGDYHHFRDEDGQELALDQDTADQLLAEQSVQEPQASAASEWDKYKAPTGSSYGTTRVGDIYDNYATQAAGQAEVAKGQSDVFDQYAQEAAQTPADQQKRIRLQGSSGKQGQTAPRQIGENLWDNGNGTLTRHVPATRGTPGGMQPYSAAMSGPHPKMMELANDAQELRANQHIDAQLAADSMRSRKAAEIEQFKLMQAKNMREREDIETRMRIQQADLDEKSRLFEQKQASLEGAKITTKEDWGTTILSAIAAGLGAYGAATTGSPNFALDIINRSKQQKLATQEANIANAKDNVAIARDERDMVSNSLEGQRLERKAAIEKEQLDEMRKLAMESELAAVQPQLNSLIQQADKQYADTMAQLYSQWRTETTERYRPGTAGTPARNEVVIDPALAMSAEVGKLKSQAREGGADARSGPVYWNGEELATLERESANKVNEANDKFVNFLDNSEELNDLQKNGNMASDVDRGRMNALTPFVVNALRKAGDSSDTDRKAYMDAVGAGDFDLAFRLAQSASREAIRIMTRETKNLNQRYLGTSKHIDDYVKSRKVLDPDTRADTLE
jgi:hypothetical protein